MTTEKSSAVRPPSESTLQQMYGEGVRFLQSIGNELPNVSKAKLKAMLKDLGGIEGVFLPKIFFPTDKNLVTYKGRQYYYLHHIKGDKIWLLDIETNRPLELPWSDIDEVGKGWRTQNLDRINQSIRSWNAKVDALDSDKQVGLITIPLRVVRTLRLIDARLAELMGQKQSIEQMLDKPSFGLGGVESWRAENIQALKSGELMNNDQDAVDTAVFHYIENPQQLLADLPSFQISQRAKITLQTMAQAEIAARAQSAAKEERTWQEREQRMQGDMGNVQQPVLAPLPEMQMSDLPAGSPVKPNAYRSPHSWAKQKPIQLKEIDFQIGIFNEVRSALDNIRQQIGSIPTGNFTNDFLRGPDGAKIRSNLESFLKVAYKFIMKYSVNVFTEEGKVNRLLFSNVGGLGNAELAVEMNRLFNAVKKALEGIQPTQYEVQPTIPVDLERQTPTRSQPVSASSSKKNIKTAKYLEKVKQSLDKKAGPNRWSGVSGSVSLDWLNITHVQKIGMIPALRAAADQKGIDTQTLRYGSYELEIEFESSGYNDPGVSGGSIDRAYPPEGSDERKVTGGTLNLYNAEAQFLLAVPLTPDSLQFVEREFYKEVENAPLNETPSKGDVLGDQQYHERVDEGLL